MTNKFRINHPFKFYTLTLTPIKSNLKTYTFQYQTTLIWRLIFSQIINIITDMKSNKIKVRFNYGGQNTVLVNQAQKGPVDLAGLVLNPIKTVKQQTSTTTHKQSEQIATQQLLQDNLHQLVKQAENKAEALQSKKTEVLQNTTLKTYKSQEVLPSVEPEVIPAKESKKSTLIIEDVDEAEFNKNPQKLIDSPIQQPIAKQLNSASITAPNFKTITKEGGKPVKEYTKVQNTANYQYSNIPVKDEDQFTGCFGCMRRKPKTYSVQKK